MTTTKEEILDCVNGIPLRTPLYTLDIEVIDQNAYRLTITWINSFDRPESNSKIFHYDELIQEIDRLKAEKPKGNLVPADD